MSGATMARSFESANRRLRRGRRSELRKLARSSAPEFFCASESLDSLRNNVYNEAIRR